MTGTQPPVPRLPPTAAAAPGAPWIEMVEQPQTQGLRFRYRCEGRLAGTIPGERSTEEQKTYPAIRIHNGGVHSAAIVVVSCVSKDAPYTPHPHSLVGQSCKDGVCTVRVSTTANPITFPNIGIQCCKRSEVARNLKERDRLKVDPFNNVSSVLTDSSSVDLTAVRLCFQAFLPDQTRKFRRIVTPILSHPIIDKKSIKDLKICRISQQAGQAKGGEEIILLCEKINKDDIAVRFYEETEDGVIWEAFAEFTHQDIHRQYAIVFRTPAYRDQNIRRPVSVLIQLRRPSIDEAGHSKPFQYTPNKAFEERTTGAGSKRKQGLNFDRIPTTVLPKHGDGGAAAASYTSVSTGGLPSYAEYLQIEPKAEASEFTTEREVSQQMVPSTADLHCLTSFQMQSRPTPKNELAYDAAVGNSKRYADMLKQSHSVSGSSLSNLQFSNLSYLQFNNSGQLLLLQNSKGEVADNEMTLGAQECVMSDAM